MKRIVVLALALLAVPAGAQTPTVLGPQAEACKADSAAPSVLVNITGFKDRSGNLRVELYPATDADFLAPGARLRAEGKVFERIDVPTPSRGVASICVAVPGPGTYALSVLHDRNANGKLNAFSDGFGFPNNPRLGTKKPKVALATFTVGAEKVQLDIVLNYVSGFKPRPVRDPA